MMRRLKGLSVVEKRNIGDEVDDVLRSCVPCGWLREKLRKQTV